MDVQVRKFKESDAQEFQTAVLESIEHVGEWLPWCTPDYNIDDAKQWASSAADTWAAGTDYRFVIEDSKTGNILGSVGINQVVPQHSVGNMGYWVRKSAVGQGVCSRAALLVVQYAFTELGFQRIEIHVHPENYASIRVAEQLGGLDEGILRNKLVHNGVSGPARCFSVIPDDLTIGIRN